MNHFSDPSAVISPPLRHQRRHKGSTLLSPRDRWACQWIAQQHAISLEHLPWLLGQRTGHGAKHPHIISESAARQVLVRWQKLGYIEQKNIFTNSPPWIWLSKSALSELDLGYAYAVPHLASLPHLHAEAHVRLALEQLHPDDTWKSLRQRKGERPRSRRATYTPDGEWQSATTPGRTAIEVELSVKRADEFKRVLTDLSMHYERVWCFALSKPYQTLMDVLSHLPTLQDRVSLYELEQFHAYHPLSL